MRIYKLAMLCGLLLCVRLWADAIEDVEQLRDEATAVLRQNAIKPVSPYEFAMVVYRLEKAQSILEAAGETQNALAQEINSALFWARRSSNVHVIRELTKIRAENPPLKLTSQEKKRRNKVVADGEAPLEIDIQEDAKEAFRIAQEFAQSHSGDDYMISLRYFQMANEYSGTDYAMKAMALARDAQIRFAVKTGSVKDAIPDTPEMQPVKEADALVEAGKIEQAFELYKKSFKIKDTQVAHRHAGQAYFRRAQQMKDDVNTTFEAFVPEYQAAYKNAWVKLGRGNSAPFFNENNPAWQSAIKKYQNLIKTSNDAMMRYLYAQWEFERVLKMAPDGRDFDAAAYVGLCYSARPDIKPKARDYLKKFIKDYEPQNEIERMIFEFCKTEFERVSK
ncbi:MAG: hypothetical protein V1899_00625 [Planctomycetota bacterium]